MLDKAGAASLRATGHLLRRPVFRYSLPDHVARPLAATHKLNCFDFLHQSGGGPNRSCASAVGPLARNQAAFRGSLSAVHRDCPGAHCPRAPAAPLVVAGSALGGDAAPCPSGLPGVALVAGSCRSHFHFVMDTPRQHFSINKALWVFPVSRFFMSLSHTGNLSASPTQTSRPLSLLGKLVPNSSSCH